MKWVLIASAVLATFIAIVLIIGSLLPEGHRASSSARYKRSPEEIWNIITDFASAPSWRTDLKAMEQMPERQGHAVWVEISKQGRMTYEVVEFDAPKRMVTQIADEKLPFGGNWTYEISPVDDGSMLTITENGEIYNPIFRFMARFIFGYNATMEKYLKDLGQKFGEEITIIKPTED